MNEQTLPYVFDFPVILIAALFSLVVGFIWYNPKVFGTIWQKGAGLTDEDIKGGNMPLIFGLSYVMAVIAGFALVILGIVIHQNGVFSTFAEDPETGSKLAAWLSENVSDWTSNFRTFKHGALHGFITGLFIVFPIFVTQGLYNRKKFSYMLVTAGYWMVTLALMGGFICQFSGRLF